MSEVDYSAEFKKRYTEYRNSQPKVNIFVAGATGAGKSSLVNLVFKKPDVAKAGAGRPVTSEIELFEHDLLNIYDSMGYETGEGNQEAFNKTVFTFIENQEKNNTPIDIIWYCVSAPAARFTDLDTDLVKRLKDAGKPVAIVLTQIDVATEDQCQDLASTIRQGLGRIDIFESSTDEKIKVQAGLDELYSWSVSKLDEARSKSFISASYRKLEEKSEEASAIVQKRAIAAGTIALSPIPASDAPLLAGLQLEMLAELASLWDMMSIGALVGNIGMDVVVMQLGKCVAGNLLKWIPGGQLVGGLINAAVASGITWALGSAFNEIGLKVNKLRAEGKNVDISQYFAEEFQVLVGEQIRKKLPSVCD